MAKKGGATELLAGNLARVLSGKKTERGEFDPSNRGRKNSELCWNAIQLIVKMFPD